MKIVVIGGIALLCILLFISIGANFKAGPPHYVSLVAGRDGYNAVTDFVKGDSEEESKNKAMSSCKSKGLGECKVLQTVSNGCLYAVPYNKTFDMYQQLTWANTLADLKENLKAGNISVPKYYGGCSEGYKPF